MGTIPDADHAFARCRPMDSPQKMMIEFLDRRRLETGDVQSGGIEARAQILHRAVFPAGVHCLKNDEQTPLMFGKKDLLPANQLLAKLLDTSERLLLRRARRI